MYLLNKQKVQRWKVAFRVALYSTLVIPLSDVLLLSSLFCDIPRVGFILSASAFGWVAASRDWLLASLFMLSGREKEKHYFCLFLKSEKEVFRGPPTNFSSCLTGQNWVPCSFLKQLLTRGMGLFLHQYVST